MTPRRVSRPILLALLNAGLALAGTVDVSGVLSSVPVGLASTTATAPTPGNIPYSGTVTSSGSKITSWDIKMPAVGSQRGYEFTPSNSIMALYGVGPLASYATCPAAIPTSILEFFSSDYMTSLYIYYTPDSSGAFANPLLTPLDCTFTSGGQSTPYYLYSVYGSAVTDYVLPITGPPGSGASTSSITPNGVVPIDSTASVIQPGSWVSIYGSNLATGTATWNGDFPQSLLGTSVTINGKNAYLWFVSPTQINLQAPDDPTTGPVTVAVTTPTGTTSSTVTLGAVGPSLSLLDATHVAGIIARSDGSGAYGGGTYDIVGPTGNSLGYPTVAAKAGDTLVLFGVGFGQTNPAVPSGKPFSAAAPTTNTVQFTVNGVTITPTFAGLTSAGLYQFNLPPLPAGLGKGDVTLQATVAGVKTPTGVVLSLQ